jgi:hypothetical protein
MCWCPEGDLNPHDHFGSADFKSAVSADFTIRATLGRPHLALEMLDRATSMLSHQKPLYFPEYNARYISRLRMIACTYSRVSV